jgi:hypothetical protein
LFVAHCTNGSVRSSGATFIRLLEKSAAGRLGDTYQPRQKRA